MAIRDHLDAALPVTDKLHAQGPLLTTIGVHPNKAPQQFNYDRVAAKLQELLANRGGQKSKRIPTADKIGAYALAFLRPTNDSAKLTSIANELDPLIKGLRTNAPHLLGVVLAYGAGWRPKAPKQAARTAWPYVDQLLRWTFIEEVGRAFNHIGNEWGLEFLESDSALCIQIGNSCYNRFMINPPCYPAALRLTCANEPCGQTLLEFTDRSSNPPRRQTIKTGAAIEWRVIGVQRETRREEAERVRLQWVAEEMIIEPDSVLRFVQGPGRLEIRYLNSAGKLSGLARIAPGQTARVDADLGLPILQRHHAAKQTLSDWAPDQPLQQYIRKALGITQKKSGQLELRVKGPFRSGAMMDEWSSIADSNRGWISDAAVRKYLRYPANKPGTVRLESVTDNLDLAHWYVQSWIDELHPHTRGVPPRKASERDKRRAWILGKTARLCCDGGPVQGSVEVTDHYACGTCTSALRRLRAHYGRKPTLGKSEPVFYDSMQCSGDVCWIRRTDFRGDWVNALAYDAATGLLYVASGVGHCRRLAWDGRTLTPDPSDIDPLTSSEVLSLVIDSSGAILAGTAEDGCLQVKNGHVERIDGLNGNKGFVQAVTTDLSGRIAAAFSKENCLVSFQRPNPGATRIALEEPVLAIISGANGGVYFTSGATVYFWDLLTKDPSSIFSSHRQPVRALASDEPGKRFVSGGIDPYCCVWGADGNQIATLQGHTDAVNALVVDSRRIVSASADRSCRVWTWNGELVGRFDEHLSPINALALDPQRGIAFSGSDDGVVYGWAIETGKRISYWCTNDSPALDPHFGQPTKLHRWSMLRRHALSESNYTEEDEYSAPC